MRFVSLDRVRTSRWKGVRLLAFLALMIFCEEECCSCVHVVDVVHLSRGSVDWH